VKFIWANERGISGMKPPSYWEARGWIKVAQHPRWPLSWLMEKR